jgi:hypothetical protein
MNEKVIAFIHSLKDKANDYHVLGEVIILQHTDNNNVIAEYDGKKYQAVFNPFVGKYYVDNIYGYIDEE